MSELKPCLAALQDYGQLGNEGTLVSTSRQAIHETLDHAKALTTELAHTKEMLAVAENTLVICKSEADFHVGNDLDQDWYERIDTVLAQINKMKET